LNWIKLTPTIKAKIIDNFVECSGEFVKPVIVKTIIVPNKNIPAEDRMDLICPKKSVVQIANKEIA